ncbi:MAG: histidine phosphatase family protein [Deltaproteobacteria bacterium]|nr:histidine phosphatase family protein [Deltaproteobacteria bacterium]
MVKLGFIRHARTQWNLEKKIQGREDIALCREGISQACLWGEILKPEKFDLIISSPMIRAKQTAKIISRKIFAGIEYDDDLREQDFGTWEGQKLVDIRKQAPGEIELQESRGWEFCPPGGEPRTRVLKRGLKATARAAKDFDKKNILVVTHQSVMKAIIYKIMGENFTPGKVPLLKDCHLHALVWNKKIKIEKLNSIRLL